MNNFADLSQTALEKLYNGFADIADANVNAVKILLLLNERLLKITAEAVIDLSGNNMGIIRIINWNA